MRKKIERILVFGDSLSDRGTMAKSALNAFSGLPGHSPHGRFTNGYVWLDYFIYQLKGQNLSEPVAIQATPLIKKSLFSINNNEYVGAREVPVFARTYCKGGLTAHDYSEKFRAGELILNIEAELLATLASMRKEAARDDEYIQLSEADKQNTLVIEWSGANDLITINHNPTLEAATLAVNARIEHLNNLVQQGYRCFVLFNLPDLSLTPRYQSADSHLRQQTQDSVMHFNHDLQQAITAWRTIHPECTIHLFDANQLFVDAYQHPEKFKLDETKKHEPFLDSRAFKDNDPHTTAAGYMFWDEVHPTEALHVQLAHAFYQDIFCQHYEFNWIAQPLITQFREAYGMKWEDDSHGTCGGMKRSRIDYLSSDLKLQDILHHGLFNQGHRTFKVMRELGWVHGNKQCASEHPSVAEAWSALRPETTVVESPSNIESGDVVVGLELNSI